MSAATLLLALLRPLLLARLGASATYLAWLLVPMMLMSPLLPELEQRAPGLIIQADAEPIMAAMSTTPLHSAAPAAEPISAPALLLLWLLGMLAVALVMAQRQRRFTQGLRRGGASWIAPAGSSPALLGLWRPRLVLPQDFAQRFSAEEQRLILAHEAVHAGRRDNAWNLLAAGLLLLQWFNPLAWWALGRMRADQELACDAAVANSHGGEFAKHYLAALLKSCQEQRLPMLANGWGARHPMLERARMLGRHRRSAPRRRLGLLAVLALCAGITALARAAQPAAPQAIASQPERRAGDRAVSIRLDVQQGGGAWAHRQLTVTLPAHYPVTGHTGIRLDAKQGDWCLGLQLYGFPDGSIRPMAELMDAGCQTSLTTPREVPFDGQPVELVAELQAQELRTKIRIEWGQPDDPRLPALPRPPEPPAEQVAAQRAHIASQLASRQALDEAWKRARGEAAVAERMQPAPPALPAASAAIPTLLPAPPATPRGPVE